MSTAAERIESLESPSEQLTYTATAMVKALVDHPDEVHIKAIVGESVVLLELHVHAEDIGKVIGKKGQHAGALRTLLTAAAGKFKMQVRFEIVDPHFAERSVRLSSSRKARSAGSRHARS